jgi:hypothetical protein
MKKRIEYSAKAVEKIIKKLTNNDYRLLDDGEIAINSPFVGDTTYDCRINIEKQCFFDFESSEGGNIEQLVSELADVSIGEARDVLIGLGEFNVRDVIPKEPVERNVKKVEMPAGAFTFDKSNRFKSVFNFDKAIDFLRDKNVDYKKTKKYDLRWTEASFISSGEKKINISNRIIIPSYEDGMLVYYQARDYSGKSNLRYKNPPKEIQSKSMIVPFYDNILNDEILFISEGPWEAINYSGTYMLGPGFNDIQLTKIREKNPKAIYLVPDNDETGRRKIAKNIQLIKSNLDCPIYIVKWWKGDYKNFKDPIDANIDFDELVNSDFIEVNRHTELRILLGEL